MQRDGAMKGNGSPPHQEPRTTPHRSSPAAADTRGRILVAARQALVAGNPDRVLDRFPSYSFGRPSFAQRGVNRLSASHRIGFISDAIARTMKTLSTRSGVSCGV